MFLYDGITATRPVFAVPMREDNQLLQLSFASDENLTVGMRGGRPVAVIVLQDGTELHFFQFIDSDDESSDADERYTL